MAKHMFSDVYNQHHFTLLWYIYIYLEKPTAEGWHGCHSKNCWLPLIQFCYCSPFLVCGVQLLFVFLKKENYSEQMSSSTQNLKGLFQIDCPPNYSCSLQDLQVFNLFFAGFTCVTYYLLFSQISTYVVPTKIGSFKFF